MRTRKYKIAHFYYNIDVWELYDLEKDPHELNNVFNDPAYADVAKEMQAKLKQLMKDVGDTGTLEEFREITDKDFGKLND